MAQSYPPAAAAAAAADPPQAGLDMYGEPWDTTRIAFGSCSKQDRPQPLWAPIVEGRPHAFLWLGDAVYADKSLPVLGFARWSGTVEGARSDFDRQLARPEYAPLLALRDRGMLLDGARDDHDSITNDANRHSPNMREAQDLFLDFLGVPEDSPRRARPAAYSAHAVGPPGRRVKAILLDVRGQQDAIGAPGGHIIGEDQWDFLERELLRENDAQLTLVGSGLQVASANKVIAEGWKQFPEDRRRLYALLARAAAAGHPALLLSGDVHMSEITRTHACPDGGAGAALPIYDVTSSGMTHSWGNHRLVPASVARWLYARLFDQSRLVDGFYLGLNYATVEVDWLRGGSPGVRVSVRDRDGAARVALSTTLADLVRPVERPGPDALADCAAVEALEFGTGGRYFRGVDLGLIAWLAFCAALIAAALSLRLACRRLCGNAATAAAAAKRD